MNPIAYMEIYHTHKYTWFLLRSKSQLRWSSLTCVFKLEIWLAVLLSLLIFAVIIMFMDINKHADTLRHFFNAWAILLNISVNEIQENISYRIILFSWVAFSIAVSTVFQSFMTSYYIEPGREHQIDTFKELKYSDLQLAYLYENGKKLSSTLKNFRPMYLGFMNNCDLLHSCFRNSNIAAMTSEETFLYTSRLYFRDFPGSFHKFSSDGVIIQETINMFPTSPHLPYVNRLIKRLVESGIVKRIVDDFVDPSGWTRGVRLKYNAILEYESLSVFHMTSPFAYISIGLCLSFLTFIGEIIIFNSTSLIHRLFKF